MATVAFDIAIYRKNIIVAAKGECLTKASYRSTIISWFYMRVGGKA
jgi:hypothetical protein